MKQLSIFDLVDVEQEPDFTQMPIKQIAAYIGEKTGLQFIPDTRFHGEFNEYIAYHTSNIFFTVGLGNYQTLDERRGKLFIEVGYENKKDKSGGGMPCDSFQEAICFYQRFLTTR